MEPKKTLPDLHIWQKALAIRSFRNKISISLVLLIGCALSAPVIFQYVQQRKGIVLNDYLLAQLPTFDLSTWIFTLLYVLIITGVISIATNPYRFVLTLHAYILLTVFRFITLLLTPLEPPVNIIELHDPFVQHLFYQQSITKDLFFSGHTSLLVLLTLAAPNKNIYKVLLAGTLVIGFMLLIQHAHYTVDVLFAPGFAWLAFYASSLINKDSGNNKPD